MKTALVSAVVAAITLSIPSFAQDQKAPEQTTQPEQGMRGGMMKGGMMDSDMMARMTKMMDQCEKMMGSHQKGMRHHKKS